MTAEIITQPEYRRLLIEDSISGPFGDLMLIEAEVELCRHYDWPSHYPDAPRVKSVFSVKQINLRGMSINGCDLKPHGPTLGIAQMIITRHVIENASRYWDESDEG